MKKVTLTTSAAALVAAPSAFGVITTAVFNQELPNSTNYYLDLDGGTLSTSSLNSEIGIEFYDGSNASGFGSGYHGKARVFQATLGSNVAFFTDTSNFLARFALGEQLDAPNAQSSAYTEDFGTGNGGWGGFVGTAYFGFNRGSGQGWVELDYDGGFNGSGSIEVVSFAYNSDGPLTAGQVPEPASTAAVAALLAGSAALYKRRRGRKAC
jgi:hypothetical protein